jgi:hypothetical protein
MKIYLETSVINFLFAEDTPEKMKITNEFFNIINEYEPLFQILCYWKLNKHQNKKKNYY